MSIGDRFKRMVVMFSNHSSLRYGYYLGRGEPVGWLLSPDKRNFQNLGYTDIMPYALDNGKFAVWSAGKKWDADFWWEFCQKVSLLPNQPKWAIVPDEVADKKETLRLWDFYSDVMRNGFGFKPAFAVQDGMTKEDVPKDADVVFVGGSTEWKWRTAEMWCKEFPRVHVGRVNNINRCWDCEEWGAESIDGTGWFRDGVNDKRFRDIEKYFKGYRKKSQLSLEL